MNGFGRTRGAELMGDHEHDAIALREQRTDAVVDAGLRAYMLAIYNCMVLGLVVTGLAALCIYLLSVTGDAAGAAKVLRNGAEIPARIASGGYLTPLGLLLFESPLKWLVVLSPLAMVLVLSFTMHRLSPAAGRVLFIVFAALMGLSLSTVFLVFTHNSVVRVFFITAAAFGTLSLWGYTTKRDLSGFGSFLIMGLFGVIIAALVNVALGSQTVQFVISVVGVLVFSGLTAWDTQRLKDEYIEAEPTGGITGAAARRSAILGALSLYLNFINLFTMLLQLLGQREE
jgi:FtsH-binding integral membrane protein